MCVICNFPHTNPPPFNGASFEQEVEICRAPPILNNLMGRARLVMPRGRAFRATRSWGLCVLFMHPRAVFHLYITAHTHTHIHKQFHLLKLSRAYITCIYTCEINSRVCDKLHYLLFRRVCNNNYYYYACNNKGTFSCDVYIRL